MRIQRPTNTCRETYLLPATVSPVTGSSSTLLKDVVHVDVTTVDEWWTEWAKAEEANGRSAQVSMIKIDVEGAELLGRVLFFVFFKAPIS